MKKFTKEDIGKKFRRRNGDVVTCTELARELRAARKDGGQ